MGFLSTMKAHAASGNKDIKAKYTRTVVAKDGKRIVEVKVVLNTIVIDTSEKGVLADTAYGGSVKAGEHGTETYKSGASAKLAELLEEVFEADVSKEGKKRTGQADTLEPSKNGQHVES